MSYINFIERIGIINNPKVIFSTGDPGYPGTALEVYDENRKTDLLHFIVDRSGERQILIFGNGKPYRISLDNLEQLIKEAKEKVNYIKGYS